jgi:peptidoglycan/LPS O-acetylase OafA/YrhL
MTKDETGAGRLEPLDALRGIAAIGVAFYHYQHFGGDPNRYPWAQVEFAAWFYARGWMLVDFFFLLSGIVLTYKYLQPLAERKLRGRDFFFLRLSRIYPLHVASLVLCAAVQWRLMVIKSPPLIYPTNDAYHFVLNLFFLQNGTAEEGYSFNGASWSIATEVFAYVAFFTITYRYGRQYVVAAAGAVIVALCVYKARLSLPFANETMARTMIGFFVGSLLFLAIRRAEAAGYARRLGVVALVVLGAIVVLANVAGYDAFVGGTGFRTAVPHLLTIFPLVIVSALHVPPLARAMSVRPLTFLGDISYSVYLLHVPLQMVIISVLRARGVAIPTEDPRFLLGFLGALLLIASLTHRFFEVPARSWLRRRLLATGAS